MIHLENTVDTDQHYSLPARVCAFLVVDLVAERQTYASELSTCCYTTGACSLPPRHSSFMPINRMRMMHGRAEFMQQRARVEKEHAKKLAELAARYGGVPAGR